MSIAPAESRPDTPAGPLQALQAVTGMLRGPDCEVALAFAPIETAACHDGTHVSESAMAWLTEPVATPRVLLAHLFSAERAQCGGTPLVDVVDGQRAIVRTPVAGASYKSVTKAVDEAATMLMIGGVDSVTVFCTTPHQDAISRRLACHRVGGCIHPTPVDGASRLPSAPDLVARASSRLRLSMVRLSDRRAARPATRLTPVVDLRDQMAILDLTDPSS